MVSNEREVPEIMGYQCTRATYQGSLRDVRIVKSAAGYALAGKRVDKLKPGGGGQIHNLETAEEFVFEQLGRLTGRQPEFHRQPCGHRVKLQTAMPCGAGLPNTTGGDSVHDLLTRGDFRAKIHDTPEQHAGIEKTIGQRSQRSRSSSISAARSTFGNCSRGAVGRTIHRPAS